MIFKLIMLLLSDIHENSLVHLATGYYALDILLKIDLLRKA